MITGLSRCMNEDSIMRIDDGTFFHRDDLGWAVLDRFERCICFLPVPKQIQGSELNQYLFKGKLFA